MFISRTRFKRKPEEDNLSTLQGTNGPPQSVLCSDVLLYSGVLRVTHPLFYLVCQLMFHPWNEHQTPYKPCTKQDMWSQTWFLRATLFHNYTIKQRGVWLHSSLKTSSSSSSSNRKSCLWRPSQNFKFSKTHCIKIQPLKCLKIWEDLQLLLDLNWSYRNHSTHVPIVLLWNTKGYSTKTEVSRTLESTQIYILLTCREHAVEPHYLLDSR